MNELANEVCSILRDRDGLHVEAREVTKNNGVIKHAILIEDGDVMPTFYLENFRSNDPTEIADEIVDNAKKVAAPISDVNELKNKKIIYQVMNYEKNKDNECRYSIRILDLLLVPYFVVSEESNYCARVRITDKLADLLSLDFNQQKAVSDTIVFYDVECKELLDLFEGLFPDCGEAFSNDGTSGLVYYVGDFGSAGSAAAVLLSDRIKVLAEEQKSDLVVIPSSIHELLVLKNDHFDFDEIKGIVSMVNANCVSEEEFLSNNIYYYSRNNGALEVIDESFRSSSGYDSGVLGQGNEEKSRGFSKDE